MKKVILVALVLVALIACAHSLNTDSEKLFKMQMSIEYDGVTLAQAYEIEKAVDAIRKYSGGNEVKKSVKIEMKPK